MPSTTNTTTTTTASGDALDDLSIGFIGAGMMASALMDGLVQKGVVKNPSSIICSDVYQPSLDKAAAKGYRTTQKNTQVVLEAQDVVIVAVKPNVVDVVCQDIVEVVVERPSNNIGEDALIISIAAGVSLTTFEENFPIKQRIVRVMPNTGCLIGQSASGFTMGSHCLPGDRDIVQRIFGAVGVALEIQPEHLLNAVTGLSGSAPAFVYEFIEALADGGVRSGLTRAEAQQLAAQTVKGAAEMVLQTGEHPGTLKDMVCSPGGTTIAGVDALENGGFRAATIEAVKAATKRSMQLAHVPEEQIRNKYNL